MRSSNTSQTVRTPHYDSQVGPPRDPQIREQPRLEVPEPPDSIDVPRRTFPQRWRECIGKAFQDLGQAAKQGGTRVWRNWPGLSQWTPGDRVKPRSTYDVQLAVRRALASGKNIRVVGGGNSWSGVTTANEGDILLKTDKLTAIKKVERLPEGGALVTVQSGINLAELCGQLEARKLSIRNLPAVLFQTLGGMVATNSHGSSWNQGGFSSMIESLVAVDGLGNRIEASATKNPEAFKALRSGIGLAGIVTELTLRVDDLYHIETEQKLMPMSELTRQSTLDKLNQENDWFMFVTLPYTGQAHVTMGNRTDEPATGRPRAGLETFALKYLEPIQRQIMTWVPALIPAFWRLAAKLAPERKFVEQPHRALPFKANDKRDQQVHTVEWFFPAEYTGEVLRELETTLHQARKEECLSTKFYTMVRFVKADDTYLSYAHSDDPEQRFVALSIPHQADPEQFYPMLKDAIRRVLERNGETRPISYHLGKSLKFTTPEELRESIPKLDEFLEQKNRLDPNDVFGASWSDRWIGKPES